MCGICGIYHAEPSHPVDEGRLKEMARVLRHRGPDDEGFFCKGPIGLGHRRLSIIDLSASGHQPMTNEDGRLWVVSNGEIYNYLELRQQLIARGHQLQSSSDTEVILHLYEDEGPACVSRLNGMFAFALWDQHDRTLFAARDRFGIKPFYYAIGDGTFVFASEIKALLQAGGRRPELNPEGLADYVTFQFCLGDKTLFRGVRKLLPGHTLLVRADGTITIRRYWDLDFTVDTHHTEEYFEHQMVRLLEDTVRLQLRADVAVGTHLSGGLDSSALSCLAGSLLGAPIHTFSGGFREGPQYDETRYARLVADRISSVHHEVYPTAMDFVKVMPRLIYQMDEPAAGPGLFPQFFVSQLASQHVKVVLGGQGGDELFGGYARYLVAYLEQCLKGGIEGTQEEQKYVVTFESIVPHLRQLRGYEPLLRYFWRDGLFEREDRRYLRLIERSEGTTELIDPSCLPDARAYDCSEAFCELFRAAPCRALINKMTWFDMQTLLPALLQVEDRTSMAVSLESRVPILDHRLVEVVASMPPMIKYKGGQSKYIFRRAVRHVIPEEIAGRTDKMGFPVPLSEWLGLAPVREFVRDTLMGSRARSRGLIRSDRVEALLGRQRPYGRGLWGLLCLELWAQAFLDGTPELS